MWPPTSRPLRLALGDHDRGVPADERADPALDLLVAGEPRLALGRDRVDVVGAAQRGHADLLLAGPLEQPQHDVAGALAAALVDQRVEGLEPVLVSSGSMSGSWVGRPSWITDVRWPPAVARGGASVARVGGCFVGHPLIVSRVRGRRMKSTDEYTAGRRSRSRRTGGPTRRGRVAPRCATPVDYSPTSRPRVHPGDRPRRTTGGVSELDRGWRVHRRRP